MGAGTRTPSTKIKAGVIRYPSRSSFCSLLSALLIASLVIAPSAWAAQTPPDQPPNYPIPDNVAVPTPTYHVPLASTLYLGDIFVTLNKTKLSELTKRFPALKIHGSGDAGNAQDWVCISVPTADGMTLIWPISGEMGGMDTIIEIDAAYASPNPPENCHHILTVRGQPDLDAGIWLGTTEANAIKALGKPNHRYQSVISYAYYIPTSHPNSTPGASFSVYGSIDLEIKNGRIWRMWISQIISD